MLAKNPISRIGKRRPLIVLYKLSRLSEISASTRLIRMMMSNNFMWDNTATRKTISNPLNLSKGCVLCTVVALFVRENA